MGLGTRDVVPQPAPCSTVPGGGGAARESRGGRVGGMKANAWISAWMTVKGDGGDAP